MAGTSSPAFLLGRGRICHRCLRAQSRGPVGSQWRPIHLSVLAKRAKAAKAWEEYAKQIEDGTRKNPWDMLEERGYVKDVAGQRDVVRELMRQRRIGAYVGIDPTAASLHVGHLLPLMPLFWMYMHGYGATTLIGGATAKIGDPTDRLKSREKTDRATMTMNMTKIHYQLKKIWTNVEIQAARHGYKKEWAWKRAIVNNNTWWNSLPMLEVLRRIGTAIRIGPMLSRDTVKRKMTEGDGVSFAEFSYPLMQGWDWWHMFNTMNVRMQIGGSDQFGNILSGIETIKAARSSEPDPDLIVPRESEYDDPVGFTVPLLTDSAGVKFGKSAGNAVWLDQFQTTAYDLYGYFVRRPDADVERLLKLFTFLPMETIEQLMAEHNANPSQRVAHHALAVEVLTLVHGLEVAKQTQAEHRAMYTKGLAPQASSKAADAPQDQYLPEEGRPTTPNNAPRIDMILPESVILGKSIGRILYAAGLATSAGDGHRLAMQQGAYVGAAPGQKAGTNKGMLLGQLQFTPVKAWFPEDTKNFLIDGKMLILRKGKHNVRVIEMVSDEEYATSGQTYPGQPYTGRVRMLNEKLKEVKAGRATVDKDSVDSLIDELSEDDPDAESTIVFPEKKPRQQVALEKELDKHR